jgi:hypothetical protein|tara:strand:+ start:957 stop:2078 length:1122 start_codon:yes stop_codon:yes gene_type:complete
MSLFKGTIEQYYGFNAFTVPASNRNIYTIDFPTIPSSTGDFDVYLTGTANGVTKTERTLLSVYSVTISEYNPNTGRLVLSHSPDAGGNVEVILKSPDIGNYQYITIDDVVANFIVGYVGEGKLISKARRADIQFHAMRSLQELSYDTLKSTKAIEFTVGTNLLMKLPHDYVNYVKITKTDSVGVERVLQPMRWSSNPTAPTTETSGEYIFDSDGNHIVASDSEIWTTFKNHAYTDSGDINKNYDTDDFDFLLGNRYGLEPTEAHNNGNYYIDQLKGNIHFSSNMSGKNVILKYISDGLGAEGDMVIHKFAEEAMYKCIAYAILSTRPNIQEFVVRRYKKERFAAIRTAKLRLSNLKTEELAQVMRGKSKIIKH